MEDDYEFYNVPELDPEELKKARKAAEQDKDYEDYTRGDSFRLGHIFEETSGTNGDI